MGWKYQDSGDGRLICVPDAEQVKKQRAAGRQGVAAKAERKEVAAARALDKDGSPTRHMTALERRIFAAETGPDTWALSTVDKLKAINAGRKGRQVSMKAYQAAMRDPWFSQQLEDGWKGAARAALPVLLDASIQVATKPTKDGYQDRKLLLGLTGMYNERLELGGEVGVVHEVGDKLEAALMRSAEARRAAAARRRGDDAKVIDGTAQDITDDEDGLKAALDAALERAERRKQAAAKSDQSRGSEAEAKEPKHVPEHADGQEIEW